MAPHGGWRGLVAEADEFSRRHPSRLLIPVIEAAEQTILQRSIPSERQGRVSAFLMAPLAEAVFIPLMTTVTALAWASNAYRRLSAAAESAPQPA